jgi:predicted ArsR family transcriptional regulator
MPDSIPLTDARALRAYAHPIRMTLLGLLRREGPQTATQAAAAIGESVASCSFHLRQMAKYGLVEAAEGGRGREKPWRATAMFTSWDPEAEGAEALELALAQQYVASVLRWLRERAAEPAEWREAAQLGDVTVHLTAAELRTLGDGMRELVRPYLERLEDPGARPAGSRPVTVMSMAFPHV